MPCMSYDTNWANDSSNIEVKRLKKEADKLARIACKAMTQLEKSGRADFILIEDEEIREWWAAHKEADRKERARVAEIERKERVKAEALARLSDEEKELLGLTKPKKTKKGQAVDPHIIDVDILLKKLNNLEDTLDQWQIDKEFDEEYENTWSGKRTKK